MSTSDVVLTTIDDGVATITWNRPERNNAWNNDLERAYLEALVQCNEDPAVGAVVVTGAGKSFCPGADMQVLSGIDESVKGGSNEASEMERRPNYLPMFFDKPLIGAINGACAGVGLVQALMFDVRFAAAGSKFTFAFARRGLIAEYGSAWLLPRIVGHSAAMDLMMSSRTFFAEEAKELRLVDHIFPTADVLGAAQAYAHDLVDHSSPASMAIMKRQIREAYGMDFLTAVKVANQEMVASFTRPDFSEGVKSYLERRAPDFPGFAAPLAP